MHAAAVGAALLAALAIIGIGGGYLLSPRAMAPSFGLPPPAEDAQTTSWLRLKGVRDVASGLVLLAVAARDGHQTLGVVLLLSALIPLGDMSVVLSGKGRTATALGVHGVTAAVMILAACVLIAGAA